jgi:hypothetical protein
MLGLINRCDVRARNNLRQPLESPFFVYVSKHPININNSSLYHRSLTMSRGNKIMIDIEKLISNLEYKPR